MIHLVFTTFPNHDEATRVVRTLVEERLIACGNIASPATSIYRWQGAIAMENEWPAILKTTEERLEELTTRIKELHSYTVPEVVAVPVAGASEDYAQWVEESCKK